VVDQTSATLGVANERVIPVNRNHMTICKFTGVGDEVYKLVLSQIQRFVEEAVIVSASSLARSSTPSQPAQVPLVHPIQIPDSKMNSDGWGIPTDSPPDQELPSTTQLASSENDREAWENRAN
jgi:hypothetical protein